MEGKHIRRINITFKILAWLQMFVALMALVMIGHSLITKDISVSGYVWNCVTILIDSLLLTYIFIKTKVSIS